ncbi:helix-turn-helix transcriptional regulator [Roseospirillum parvum]|uniref:Regulatory protein, luxR family n=1 Tax=Roseospirillum parvum TaxID=83401 RepID=A0A1G8CV91_9PROT|nr:helix-turn-helix transcriptional regulator [Roseospirillum parvum]SDH49204.1 regulatory protein, luxR family [Roseospirillum parvum]
MGTTQRTDAAWMAGCAELVARLERPDFAAAFTALLRQVVPVDTLLVTFYFRDRPPRTVYHELPPELVALCVDTYAAGVYRLDPFFQTFEAGIADGVHRLRDLAPDNFYRSTYYRTFYRDTGAEDEMGLFRRLDANRGLVVSLARAPGARPYGVAQRRRLEAAFPLLITAACRHWEDAASRHWEDAAGPAAEAADPVASHVARFGDGLLSEREQEVAGLILMGHSTLSISHRLAISEGTVKAHRKHIHAKLGIASQAELFARFLKTLPLRPPDGPGRR